MGTSKIQHQEFGGYIQNTEEVKRARFLLRSVHRIVKPVYGMIAIHTLLLLQLLSFYSSSSADDMESLLLVRFFCFRKTAAVKKSSLNSSIYLNIYAKEIGISGNLSSVSLSSKVSLRCSSRGKRLGSYRNVHSHCFLYGYTRFTVGSCERWRRQSGTYLCIRSRNNNLKLSMVQHILNIRQLGFIDKISQAIRYGCAKTYLGRG